jgi:hypothetical protein
VKARGYELLPARYRQRTFKDVRHDTPREIIKDVLRLEEEITTRARALSETLEES